LAGSAVMLMAEVVMETDLNQNEFGNESIRRTAALPALVA